MSKTIQLSVCNLSLYTCEDSVFVRNFPKIADSTLKFTGRVAKKEALDYLEKLVYRDKSRKFQILTGWVSTEKGENEEILDKIADDLLQNDKAGVLKYSEYAGIYFFHIKQINNDIAQKFDIKVKAMWTQSNPKPILLYAIYLRNTFIPNYYVPAIEPELIELASSIDADDKTKISTIDADDKIKTSPIDAADDKRKISSIDADDKIKTSSIDDADEKIKILIINTDDKIKIEQDYEPQLRLNIILEQEAEQEIIDINPDLWELSQQPINCEIQIVHNDPIISQQESKPAFSPITSDEDVNYFELIYKLIIQFIGRRRTILWFN